MSLSTSVQLMELIYKYFKEMTMVFCCSSLGVCLIWCDAVSAHLIAQD